jgi:hypothetical protein
VAEHWLVWPVCMFAAVQETLIDVMVGDVDVLPPPPPPPPQPATHNEPRKERANKILEVIHASSSQIVPGHFGRHQYSTPDGTSPFFLEGNRRVLFLRETNGNWLGSTRQISSLNEPGKTVRIWVL